MGFIAKSEGYHIRKKIAATIKPRKDDEKRKGDTTRTRKLAMTASGLRYLSPSIKAVLECGPNFGAVQPLP